MKTSKLSFETKLRYLNAKVIFHIDMDAFFASCTELKEPELKHRPLAIGNSNLRSIVTTANYEARRWGIKTGMPLYQAKKSCPGLIIREPDFHFFSQMSLAVWRILARLTPRLETISIDEAYLDMTHLWQRYESPEKLAYHIQNTVFRELGLTCSIGIAPNKFLAKMASEMEKPKGTTLLFPDDIPTKLWPLPIATMWGIGYATAKKLSQNYQIHTIGDFAHCNIAELAPYFPKHLFTLYDHANGHGDAEINPYLHLPKSIGNEITLDWPINEWTGIKEVLWALTKNAQIRLNHWQLLAKTVQVSFRHQWKGGEDFDKQKHHRRHSKQFTLAVPTNSLEVIFVEVQELFHKLYQKERPLLLISVSLHNLVRNLHFRQPTWEETVLPLEHPEVSQIVVNLNHKFQKPIAFLGDILVKPEIVPHQNYADRVTHNEIRKITHQKK